MLFSLDSDPTEVWNSYYQQMMEAVAKDVGFKLSQPWKKLPKKAKDVLLYGSDKEIKFKLEGKKSDSSYSFKRNFEGVLPNLERRFNENGSEHTRWDLERYMSKAPCKACEGARLRREARSVYVGGVALHEFGHVIEFIVENDYLNGKVLELDGGLRF